MTNRVLLIDDDEITHIIGNRLLKITSFATQTISLYNGKEGLDYFQKLENKDEVDKDLVPEVIFLDINMPYMNGWDFLDEFIKCYSNKFPSIIIFMLSSSVDPEDIAKSKRYPFVKDYVVKPLTKDSIENLKNLYLADKF